MPHRDPGSVSVINTATNTVITTISIPYEPAGVAVSLDETRLYVVNVCGAVGCEVSGHYAPGSVSVIDVKAGSGTENTVIATIPLTDYFSIGIAVSQDGSRLYVTNLFDPTESFGTVSVIDTTLDSVITDIEVPPFPTGIVLNPNSPRLYVVTAEGGLSVADTTSNKLINYNDIEGIGGLAITPDGARLYAPDTEDGLIDIIDTTNDDLHLVRAIPGPTGPTYFGGFTAHPDGRRVYVTVLNDSLVGGSVAVIRTDRNRLSGPPITVGDLPIAFGQFIAPGSIQGLIDLLASFNVSSSVTNLLDAPLDAALASWKAGHRNDTIHHLRLFLDELTVQVWTKGLTDAQEDQLESMAENIISALSVSFEFRHDWAGIEVKTAGLVVPAIQSLIQVTTSFDHRHGNAVSSVATLQDAQGALAAALAAVRAGQAQNAIKQLNLYIADIEAREGINLTNTQADILVNAAQHIIALF